MSADRELITLTLILNGQEQTTYVDSRTLLVHAIREEFELTGTHTGCLTGDCGACTVMLDGRIAKSCLTLAASAAGSDLVTIEALASPALHPIQEAFWDNVGFQCGFCLPGMLFSALALLQENPSPSDAEIRHALDGTLCRCTGYHNIVKAVAAAAERMRN